MNLPDKARIIDFELFLETSGLEIVKIPVKCKACGNSFNVTLDGDEKNYWDIKEHKLVCGNCLKIKSEEKRKVILAELGYE